jgi:methylase of polypeptide subunit release factors
MSHPVTSGRPAAPPRPTLVSRVVFALARRLRTSPAVARWLFGIGIAPPVSYLLWDATTLALKRALAGYVRRGDTVLEMGTGPAAILSLHLARRRGARVTAAEICPEFVASASAQVRHNGAGGGGAGTVTVVESDLFGCVSGTFDVIFINPPYLPAGTYQTLAAAGVYEGFSAAAARSASNGGVRGSELVTRFLAEAGRHLRPGGRVLVGTNARYLPPEAIVAAARPHGLALAATLDQRWGPARVLVFERAGARTATPPSD